MCFLLLNDLLTCGKYPPPPAYVLCCSWLLPIGLDKSFSPSLCGRVANATMGGYPRAHQGFFLRISRQRGASFLPSAAAGPLGRLHMKQPLVMA